MPQGKGLVLAVSGCSGISLGCVRKPSRHFVTLSRRLRDGFTRSVHFYSPDVEVLVLGDLGELAAVLLLDVLNVVVVLRLELPGPRGADDGSGDADEEAGVRGCWDGVPTRPSSRER